MAKLKTKYMTFEKNFIGQEYRLKDCTNRIDVINALNWYNYNYNVVDTVKWLYEYLDNLNTTKEYMARVKKLDPVYIGITACSLARMSNLGCDIGQYHNTIKKIVDNELGKQVEEPIARSVVDIVQRKTNYVIAHLEYQIDNFINHDYALSDFKPYDYYKNQDIGSGVAWGIIKYYTPLVEELEAARDGSDDQCVEAYYSIGNKAVKSYIDFVSKIVENAKQFVKVNKAENKARAPRKKKYKSETQLVKNLKYAVSNDPLKLASIDPTLIIGAQSLWVYNVNYKTITNFVASGPAGLSVKGTTVIGIDPTASMKKTLRKPEASINTMLTSSKIQLKKFMDTLTTKPTEANGRINIDTILLRVIK
jgi:hypothetical protein